MHPEPDELQITMFLEQKLSAEVSMYLLEPDVTESPLLWLKVNSFYPLLSQRSCKLVPLA